MGYIIPLIFSGYARGFLPVCHAHSSSKGRLPDISTGSSQRSKHLKCKVKPVTLQRNLISSAYIYSTICTVREQTNSGTGCRIRTQCQLLLSGLGVNFTCECLKVSHKPKKVMQGQCVLNSPLTRPAGPGVGLEHIRNCETWQKKTADGRCFW